jgi:hypothetical protein
MALGGLRAAVELSMREAAIRIPASWHTGIPASTNADSPLAMLPASAAVPVCRHGGESNAG